MQGDASNAELDRAKRRGDVALSRRFAASLGLLAACAVLPWCVTQAWQTAKSSLVGALTTRSAASAESATTIERVVVPVLTTVVPVGLALVFVCVVAAFAQGGGRVAKKRAPRRPFEAPLSALVGVGSFGVALVIGLWRVLGSMRPLLATPGRAESLGMEAHPLVAARKAVAHRLDDTLMSLGRDALTLLVVLAMFACVIGLFDRWLVSFAWRRRLAAQDSTARDARGEQVAPELRRAQRGAHQALSRQLKFGVTRDPR